MVTADASSPPPSSGPAPGPAAGDRAHRDALSGGIGSVARRFTRAVDDGELALPLPGRGRTRERFRALTTLGAEDLALARLAEGHVDAAAILDELGGPTPRPGEYWGVWAAAPELLAATSTSTGWRLHGDKPFASGAGCCTHALVTAVADDGPRLFVVEVDPDRASPVPGTWPAVGMAASDSPTLHLDAVPATSLGGVDAYTDRPGFAHGGVGVAACWFGGAIGSGAVLAARCRGADPADPHARAHLGAVDALLWSTGAAVRSAADAIDADPADASGQAERRALRLRATVAAVVAEVADRCGRAMGARPLTHDPRHARRAADLAVYVRQWHAERDLERLGTLDPEPDRDWLP